MKTVICLLALLGVVQTGAAQQPALTWAESAGGRWAGRGVTDLSIPSLGLGPSTPRLRCCVPMSARWLGAAQEAEEEDQPPETPGTRAAMTDRAESIYYGSTALLMGGALMWAAVAGSDEEDTFDEEDTTDYSLYRAQMKGFGGFFIVAGVVMIFTGLSGPDLPGEVDARQDGIYLSKSFSW